MPTFIYKARVSPLELKEGLVEAETREQAVKKIADSGLFPIEVDLASGKKDSSLFRRLKSQRKVTRADISGFTRQLANLLESGLNILPALNVLKAQVASPVFISLIDDISEKVKKGEAFSESLSRHENFFSPLYVNVVRSGELSGKLNSALGSLADFLEHQEELRQKIISALVYPLIVLFVGILTVSVLLIFVIPRISVMYEEMGQALPIPTQIVVGISSIIVRYFWPLVILTAGTVFFARRKLKTREGREFCDRLKLNLPLLGALTVKGHIVQFSRTLSLLLASGIPIVSALELVGSTLSNSLIRSEVEAMSKAIHKGESLSGAVEKTKYFPIFVANVMSVAEESGTLETSLSRIANSFERDVANIIKAFTVTLEPALILIIGLIVGFIVIAMLLPIFSINLIIG